MHTNTHTCMYTLPFASISVGEDTLLGISQASFEAFSVSLMAFIRFAAMVTKGSTADCHSEVLPEEVTSSD